MKSSLSVIFYKKAEAPRKDWAPGVDGGVPSLEDIEGLELKMNRNPGGVELLSGELELLGLDGNVITIDEVAELLESVPELLGLDGNVIIIDEVAELLESVPELLGLDGNVIIIDEVAELLESVPELLGLDGNVIIIDEVAELLESVPELLGLDGNVITIDEVAELLESVPELLEESVGDELGADENVRTKEEDLEEQADICSEDELGLEENAIIVGRLELEEDDEGNVRTKPQDAEVRGAAVVVIELELLGADENVKTKDDVSVEELLEDDFGGELELGAEENVKTKDDV